MQVLSGKSVKSNTKLPRVCTAVGLSPWFGYLQQNSLPGNDEVWKYPELEHSLSRMGLDLFDLKIDFDIKNHFQAAP